MYITDVSVQVFQAYRERDNKFSDPRDPPSKIVPASSAANYDIHTTNIYTREAFC